MQPAASQLLAALPSVLREVVMKRILLVTSLIVPSLLFAVERSVIYLLFISAMVILYLLFVVTHHKPAPGTVPRRLAVVRRAGAETKEHKNIGDQPLMHR